jgi:ABC-type antimicrobial peptide transport system permease subunit
MWKIMGITLSVAFLLNSIYPAIVLSSFKPLQVFRGSTVFKTRDSYFRKALVTFQFVIAVVLIAGTIIIYQQMRFIQQTDPGYQRAQVITFPLPLTVSNRDKGTLVQTIKRELLTKTSIQSVTLANQSIENIGSMSSGSADWDGHDTSFNPKIAQLSADADFAKTLQLQLKEGRWFIQGDALDKNNVVLNEAAVKELHIHQPVLGQRFTFKGRTGRVIGVADDFKYKSMHDKTGPLVVFTDAGWFRVFTVRTAGGNITRAVADITQVWKKLLPGRPLEYNFLNDSFDRLYSEDQKLSSLVFYFSLIAIFISCLGLFGLSAFTAAQRTKEIGIRKVLGASVPAIAGMISKDFIWLVGLAVIIATPLSLLAMQSWMQGFAYRVAITWWMFALAGIIVLIIALLTVSFQAIKAAVANPVKSLRTE